MITRKEFVARCAAACTVSVCSCFGESKQRSSQTAACDSAQLKQIQSKVDAAQDRFARLIEELDSSLPEEQRKRLLHGLGNRCANSFKASLLDRYRGDIRGFLEEGLRLWMAEAHYDEAKGTIRIVDKSATCTCPLVKKGTTPASFCECTLGWQETAYSMLLGRPVKAELEESILRGDKRCVFQIRIT